MFIVVIFVAESGAKILVTKKIVYSFLQKRNTFTGQNVLILFKYSQNELSYHN